GPPGWTAADRRHVLGGHAAACRTRLRRDHQVSGAPSGLLRRAHLVTTEGMHVAHRGQISRTVAAMSSSGIRRFFELLDSVDGVISLAVGQPDFPTPSTITQA